MGCGELGYCGKACQQTDWPRHKTVWAVEARVFVLGMHWMRFAVVEAQIAYAFPIGPPGDEIFCGRGAIAYAIEMGPPEICFG